MSYSGILFYIGPSAPCLMFWFAIVTGGVGVPARDVISTRKTYAPIVVVFVGVGWRGCSTGYIGCWYRFSIGWWRCGRCSIALSYIVCPATSSVTASATLSTTTSVLSVCCRLINFCWNWRARWWSSKRWPDTQWRTRLCYNGRSATTL